MEMRVTAVLPIILGIERYETVLSPVYPVMVHPCIPLAISSLPSIVHCAHAVVAVSIMTNSIIAARLVKLFRYLFISLLFIGRQSYENIFVLRTILPFFCKKVYAVADDRCLMSEPSGQMLAVFFALLSDISHVASVTDPLWYHIRHASENFYPLWYHIRHVA